MSAADDRPSPREVIDSRQRAYRGDARDMLRAYDAEVDRLRAELAETRAAGDELALAVAPIERMGRGAPGSRLDVLITRAEAWRSVRGGAPAEPPAEPWCTGTGPSGLRAAQECAATHNHSAAPSGADEPPLPSPDPRGDGLCPNCPTDLATLDSGHGVCVECGWTSDPGKCMELYDRIDELVAVARSVVELMDRTVDMPGVVRDVVDNLRDALSAAPADDTAAPDGPTS